MVMVAEGSVYVAEGQLLKHGAYTGGAPGLLGGGDGGLCGGDGLTLGICYTGQKFGGGDGLGSHRNAVGGQKRTENLVLVTYTIQLGDELGVAILQTVQHDTVFGALVLQLTDLVGQADAVSHGLQSAEESGLGLGASALQVDLPHLAIQDSANLGDLLGGSIGDDADLQVGDVQCVLLLHGFHPFYLPSFCTKIAKGRQKIQNVLEILGVWEYNKDNTSHYPYYNTKLAY